MKRIVISLCLIVAMVFSTTVCFADSTNDMTPVLTITAAPETAPAMTITAAPETLPLIVTPAPTPVSRQAVIKALWEMAGSPVVNFIMPFTDVDEDADCAEAIRWAASEGIISGFGNATFRGTEVATREQIACMVYGFQQKVLKGGFTGAWMFLLNAEDRADISSWASEAVHWLYMNQLLTTTNGKLSPKGVMTPEKFAELMAAYKAITPYANPADPAAPAAPADPADPAAPTDPADPADLSDEPTAAPVDIKIVGGWTEVNSDMTEELQTIFDKAMEGLTGVGYTAKKLLAKQLVAGMNYKFLCDAKVVYPGAVATQKVVTIYVNLAGEATITSIEDYTE